LNRKKQLQSCNFEKKTHGSFRFVLSILGN
jgi:hypothetical protein